MTLKLIRTSVIEMLETLSDDDFVNVVSVSIWFFQKICIVNKNISKLFLMSDMRYLNVKLLRDLKYIVKYHIWLTIFLSSIMKVLLLSLSIHLSEGQKSFKQTSVQPNSPFQYIILVCVTHLLFDLYMQILWK